MCQASDRALNDLDRGRIRPHRAQVKPFRAPRPTHVPRDQVGGVTQGERTLGALGGQSDARLRKPECLTLCALFGPPGDERPDPPKKDGQEGSGGDDERQRRVLHA